MGPVPHACGTPLGNVAPRYKSRMNFLLPPFLLMNNIRRKEKGEKGAQRRRLPPRPHSHSGDSASGGGFGGGSGELRADGGGRE